MLKVFLHSYRQIKYTRVCYTLYKKCLGATRTLVRRCAFISKVHASPTPGPSAASPPTRRSGGERLDVPEHLIKGLRRWGISILEGGLDSAVQAEGLQFQPEEPKAVLIKQNDDAGSALRTGKAMAGDEACAVETRDTREQAVRRRPKSQSPHHRGHAQCTLCQPLP